MEPLDLLSTAQLTAQLIIDQVEDHDLSSPCPCEGWDVAILLDKMVTSGLLFASLCRGETPDAEINVLFPSRIAGADPSASFRDSAAACYSAFEESQLEGEMMGPLGVMVPRKAGLMVRTMDVTINTWDLAQAIEVESGVGTSHAERVLEFARGFLPKVRERTDHVRFADTAEIASSEDPLEFLILLSGRKLEWR